MTQMTSFYILYSFTWFYIYFLCFYPLNSTSELSALHATITVLQDPVSVCIICSKELYIFVCFHVAVQRLSVSFSRMPLSVCRSSADEFPQLLFISEGFYFSFIFKGRFCWIQHSFLAGLFFRRFEYIVSLPSCIISAKKFSDNIMGSPL